MVFLLFYCVVRAASNLFEDSNTLKARARKQRDKAMSQMQSHRDLATKSLKSVGLRNVRNVALASNAASRLVIAIKESQPLINQLVHDMTHGVVQAVSTCAAPGTGPALTDSSAVLSDVDSLTELVQQQMCHLMQSRQSSQLGNTSPEHAGPIQAQLASLVAEAAALHEIRSLIQMAHVPAKDTSSVPR